MNSKKTITIILVIILIAILLAAGWYCFIRQKKQTENSPVLKETTASSTTQEITSKTKLYRNEQWGFEFRYPEDWTLHPSILKSPFSKFELIGTASEEKIPNTITPSLLINIVSIDFADRASINFKKLNAITSKVIVFGVKGTKYKYKFESVPRITVDLPFGKYRILLGAKKRYEDVFNQVINTFKFLKQRNIRSEKMINIKVGKMMKRLHWL